jgi:hypothetical protein
MRERERDKTGAVKSYLNGYVLAIYLAMPKRSVAAAPNIILELTRIDILLTIIVLKIKPRYF